MPASASTLSAVVIPVAIVNHAYWGLSKLRINKKPATVFKSCTISWAAAKLVNNLTQRCQRWVLFFNQPNKVMCCCVLDAELVESATRWRI
jgi:hypothetical protein